MATPNYMNKLSIVAERHGKVHDLNEVGRRLQTLWATFEADAKGQLLYDILSQHVKIAGIHRLMEQLVEELYRMPDVSLHEDVLQLQDKDKQYGGSWHRRGGVGAFMMLCRKWDRIENALSSGPLGDCIREDARPEGILDDCGDLRRYLLLVLAWHEEVANPQTEIAF